MKIAERRAALLGYTKERLVELVISLGNDVEGLESKAVTADRIMSGFIKKIKELENELKTKEGGLKFLRNIIREELGKL